MVAIIKGQRFQAWFASMVFAAVCVAAHRATDYYNKNDKAKWVLSDLVIILIVSCVGVVAHLVIRKLFVGRFLEGGLSLLLVILWCAGLPTIMNPDHAIALLGASSSPVIINPNLYFFSWIAFACSIYIFGNYLQEATGRNLSVDASSKHSKFGGILAASVVILVTSSTIYNDADCGGSKIPGDDFCERNNFAVALGVIGIILTLLVMVATFFDKMVVVMERVVSFLLVGMTTAGVALITFDEGSGTQMSNLYFATWGAFIISIFVSAQCFLEFAEARMGDGDDAVEEAAEDEEKAEKSRHSEEQEQPVDASEGAEVAEA